MLPHNICAVIFDLDGVIVHTDELHFEAWKQLADAYSIYFDREINNRLRGVSRMNSLEIILQNYSGKKESLDIEGMADQKNGIYQDLLKQLSPADVSEKVILTLNKLKYMGIKIAIGSSSKNAKLILHQIGLLDLFDTISDGTNITHAKPNPEVFLQAAEQLNCEASQCFIVEDALVGIEAGKRGGMKTVAIGEAANTFIADYNIASLDEILEIIENVNE